MHQHSKREPPRKVGRALGGLHLIRQGERRDRTGAESVSTAMPVTFADEDQVIEEASTSMTTPAGRHPVSAQEQRFSSFRCTSNTSRRSTKMSSPWHHGSGERFTECTGILANHPSTALKHTGVCTDWTKAHALYTAARSVRPVKRQRLLPGHLMRALEFNPRWAGPLLHGAIFSWMSFEGNQLLASGPPGGAGHFMRLWVEKYGAPVLLVADHWEWAFTSQILAHHGRTLALRKREAWSRRSWPQPFWKLQPHRPKLSQIWLLADARPRPRQVHQAG